MDFHPASLNEGMFHSGTTISLYTDLSKYTGPVCGNSSLLLQLSYMSFLCYELSVSCKQLSLLCLRGLASALFSDEGCDLFSSLVL